MILILIAKMVIISNDFDFDCHPKISNDFDFLGNHFENKVLGLIKLLTKNTCRPTINLM